MGTRFTKHAVDRCRNRAISEEAVEAAQMFGLHRAKSGADVYTIGWRQIAFYAQFGIDLSRWDGVEVVCAHNGLVLTVYRNRNPHAMRSRRAA